MKITRQEILEGEKIPSFYYGLAYWKWDIAVYYPMPLNYIIRFFIFINMKWYRFRSKPGFIDGLIEIAIKKERERTRRIIESETFDQYQAFKKLFYFIDAVYKGYKKEGMIAKDERIIPIEEARLFMPKEKEKK